LNSKYRAPRHIYYGDIDDSGSFDVIETTFEPTLNDEAPERELNAMSVALPFVRERFPTHKAYGAAGMKAVFGPELKGLQKLTVNTLATMIFINEGNTFRGVELPAEAQFAPAFGICVADFDGNGTEDIFLAQNFFPLPAQTGRIDAGLGLLLLNDGKANFRATRVSESGLRIYGDQRGAALCDFDHDGRVDLAIGQNAAETKLFRNARAKEGLRISVEGQAVGATIRLGNANGWGPAREIKIGSGWRSQDAATQVMSLDGATKVQARWPGGKTTEHAIAPGAKEVRLAK
jgi:enediyne biosynthesis protein E4